MNWFALLVLAGVAVLIPTAYAGKIGAPYAPTRIAAVRKAFDFIDLGAEDHLVDLGAGDGKIVLEAARRGAVAVGFELSPIMWLVAWLRTRGKQNTSMQYGNFYRQSLDTATVIFAFLMPDNMPRVRRFLQSQPLPAAKFVLAYAFPFADVQPVTVIREPNCSALYVYDARELTRGT